MSEPLDDASAEQIDAAAFRHEVRSWLKGCVARVIAREIARDLALEVLKDPVVREEQERLDIEKGTIT